MSNSETECRTSQNKNGEKSKTKETKSKISKGNDSEIEAALKLQRERKEARRARRAEKEERQAKRERKEARRKQEEADVAQQSSDKSAKDMVATQHKQDRPIMTSVSKDQELVPIRHPMLPITPSPMYFINKDSIVTSFTSGKPQSSKPVTGTNGCRYALQVEKNHTVRFNLEEIMAYTFSEHFDRSKHYIFHKDGARGNCAWSNLIICDLPMLQKYEIARLETLYPDTKYAVVRNVHDTLTFERYLVSDTGKIYSLSRQTHHHLWKDDTGYLHTIFTADTTATHTTPRRFRVGVHLVVIQSFTQRRPKGHHVTHINGNKDDNLLKNLAYADNKGNQGKKKHKMPPPLPPVTDKTQWKIIGVLPWNGLSFSQHEVSNMGHVRKKGDSQMLKLSYTSENYVSVHLRHDNQDLKTRPKSLAISRLVAYAFVNGYSETQTTVQHLNGDRLDDRAQNLKWVSRSSTSKYKNARPIVASLVENPEARKEFPSVRKAQLELSAFTFDSAIAKYGNSFTKAVNWDGERKMALIQVVLPEEDKE